MRANRLERALEGLAADRACGIAPYVTAGDGGLERTLAVLLALERAGAVCCELGVPFSDPIADGPILQAAAQRALESGTSFDGVLELVRAFRSAGGGMPLLAFSYTNPILRRGWSRAAQLLAEAGADGLLVPDLPVEEGGPMRAAALREGLCPIFFVTPTTSAERIERSAAASRGFLYVIGRTGITGARTELSRATERYLERVRNASPVPLGVGFGIASAEQVTAVARHARLAIVGSALVQRVHEAAESADDGTAAACEAAFDFVNRLREGVRA